MKNPLSKNEKSSWLKLKMRSLQWKNPLGKNRKSAQ
jgi:hypothetical protein